MKRARTPSAAIPRKKVKRTKSSMMIPSKSLVFQANTVGAGPERKNIDSNLVGVSGLRLLSVCLIGLRQSPC